MPHFEGNIQSVTCELYRKRVDVVSMENSPHHSNVVSINERLIVEVRMNVILNNNNNNNERS